ncbi:kinase-like domain-containing protein [Hypoxylon sp. NC1633]|nr:kinase-like domain-containing protein [Hypoxylon sp. NC1633]
MSDPVLEDDSIEADPAPDPAPDINPLLSIDANGLTPAEMVAQAHLLEELHGINIDWFAPLDWLLGPPKPDKAIKWVDVWRFTATVFHRYRTSKEYFTYRNAEPKFKEEWDARELPLQGPVKLRDYLVQEVQYRQEYRGFQLSLYSWSDIWDDDDDRAVRNNYREYREYFSKLDPKQFIGKRILGYNNQNVVIKIDHVDKAERKREYAVKIGVNGTESPALRREQRLMRQLEGAAHCMPIIDPVAEFGLKREKLLYNDTVEIDDSSEDGGSSGMESRADEPPPPTLTRRDLLEYDPEGLEAKSARHKKRNDGRVLNQRIRRKAKQEPNNPEYAASKMFITPDYDPDDPYDSNHRDYIFLPYMQNGALSRLIMRMNEKGVNIPNRVLWSFWLCLIRGVIALEYPPRKFHPRRHDILGDDPPPKDGPAPDARVINSELVEQIPPPTRRWAGKRIVHFDVAAKNVLIDDLDPFAGDGEHAIIPRLRLADFGNSNAVKPNKSKRRKAGTWGYYAPEQFGIDWDHVNATERYGAELSEQPVAGNYGSWTNVWGIAMVMWQLMTKLNAILPPQRSSYAMLDEDDHIHYAPLIMDEDEYAIFDQELRTTIAACMRHDPLSRPTLVELKMGSRFVSSVPARLIIEVTMMTHGKDGLQNLHRDHRDLHQDHRDLHQDHRDLHQDHRDLHQDHRDLHQDHRDIHQDHRDIHQDHRDIHQDHRDHQDHQDRQAHQDQVSPGQVSPDLAFTRMALRIRKGKDPSPVTPPPARTPPPHQPLLVNQVELRPLDLDLLAPLKVYLLILDRFYLDLVAPFDVYLPMLDRFEQYPLKLSLVELDLVEV